MLEQVRTTLIEYLAHRLSAAQLADRLPDGWELDEAAEPEARRLTLKAIGYLAEYQQGDRTEDAVWSAISQLLRAPSPPTVGASTPVEYISPPDVTTRQSAGAGKRPPVVPA
jgi:hypothetical protein